MALKHDVFKDAIFKSASTTPALGGQKNGCDGHEKSAAKVDTVTYVNVKTGK